LKAVVRTYVPFLGWRNDEFQMVGWNWNNFFYNYPIFNFQSIYEWIEDIKLFLMEKVTLQEIIKAINFLFKKPPTKDKWGKIVCNHYTKSLTIKGITFLVYKIKLQINHFFFFFFGKKNDDLTNCKSVIRVVLLITIWSFCSCCGLRWWAME